MPIPPGATEVTTASELAQALEALSRHRELAVDLEADSMHHFRARLCFVQLASDTDLFLLDTLVPEVDPRALSALFADEACTKYFHAAGGDLQFLAEAGVRVRGLFDTHRAATLLGWPKVGLADLVHEKMGFHLPKEHQQADFSIRPLPADMRSYIADDVRYLVELGRVVREACVAADVLEEVTLDCRRLTEEAQGRPDLSEEYRLKLSRAGLTPDEIVVSEHAAQALHQLRLRWAEAADLPMGRVLSNMAIQGISTKRPSTLKELGRIPGVRGPLVRQSGAEVLALLEELRQRRERGELAPLSEKPEKNPRQRKRAEALMAWRKETASTRKVTPSVVLPNALLEELADPSVRELADLERLSYFGPKRLRLYGDELVALLRRVG